MTVIKLPYGRDYLEMDFSEEELEGILESKGHNYKPQLTEIQIVKEALENPVESQRLSELARDKDKIVIIASDHTRPVPSKIIMPLLLEEIR